MKVIYVINEKYLDDKENIVVGVADSLDKIDSMIQQYYGFFELISFTDIRDSGAEYSKVIELSNEDDTIKYRVKIIVESFILNEI